MLPQASKRSFLPGIGIDRIGLLDSCWAMEVEGPTTTFILRGIKDSPPYPHDGRLLTLEDTVEFFNLVLGLKLNQPEKQALVTSMRQL
jgi:cytochrome c peroxidase